MVKAAVPTKQQINIGLAYQNYARSKVYDKAFKESIRNINMKQSISTVRKMASKYTLAPIDCILPKGKFYPSDVLDCLCNKMIANNVALIVFVTATEDFDESTSAGQYFLHMASQTGIPIISWNADNSGFTFTKLMSEFRVLQMAPPVEHQIRAMIALLKRYNWSRFGVVTSKMAGSKQFLKTVNELTQTYEDRSFKLKLVHHEEVDENLGEAEVERCLNALKHSEARIILLYSTSVRVRKLFAVAERLGLLSEKYLWIGTQSVKGSMHTVTPPVQHGMLTVNFHTVSNAMFPPSDDVLPLIIGLAPKLFGTALSKLDYNETVSLQSTSSCTSDNENVTWPLGKEIYEFVLSFIECIHNLKKRFSQMKASFLKGNPYHAKDGQDSFFYLFNDDGKLRDSYLTISNLRKARRGKEIKEGSFYWDKVGEFTNGELRMADIEWPGGKANPPQGTPDKFHVRVVTLNEPPFVIVSDLDADTGACPGNQGFVCNWGDVTVEENGVMTNKTNYKCCTGYCVDLLNKLADDIGFTYTLYKVKDGKWGLRSEKGWNGLIQDLITHKADMCVTSLKLNSERARDIDFSVPFLDTGISIIVKIRSGVLSPTAFLEPFEYSTWAVILLVSIQGAALSIFIFEWVSPSSFNMKKYPPPGHKFSLCRSYWLVWATLFSASVSTDVPRSTVSRFMSLVWAAFGLTFLAVYTANLAAFMITRVQFYDLSGIDDDMITNAADQKPAFRYGTIEGGNTHETMKRNWKRMHEYVTSNNFFSENVAAGVEAVRREQLDAFIYDAVVLDYQAGKDANCELLTVGKWSAMTGYGIGFPKNSPHVQRVNQLMLQYQQKGDLERLQNFWLTGACVPASNSQNTSAPLGIENFMSAFVLLGMGILAAILCLSLEYIYCKQFRKTLQKFDKDGWCAVLSMSMGRSLSFTEAVGRVREWQFQARASPSLSRQGVRKSVDSNWSIFSFNSGPKVRQRSESQPPPPTIKETLC
uniref:Glutamate receptor n=2 Tax=Panagrellus redivivus TaxID=6233 RepID=A0A7E4ULG2_PANRE